MVVSPRGETQAPRIDGASHTVVRLPLHNRSKQRKTRARYIFTGDMFRKRCVLYCSVFAFARLD